MKFLIYSYRHRQWWGPDECGYTDEPQSAGRYSRAEAGAIVTKGLPGANLAIDEILLQHIKTIHDVEPTIEGWRRM